MVEWRLDCENCRHLTVVGLHDTGPMCVDVRSAHGVAYMLWFSLCSPPTHVWAWETIKRQSIYASRGMVHPSGTGQNSNDELLAFSAISNDVSALFTLCCCSACEFSMQGHFPVPACSACFSACSTCFSIQNTERRWLTSPPAPPPFSCSPSSSPSPGVCVIKRSGRRTISHTQRSSSLLYPLSNVHCLYQRSSALLYPLLACSVICSKCCSLSLLSHICIPLLW